MDLRPQPTLREEALASVPEGLYISGQWVEGTLGGRLDVEEPASGTVLHSVAAGGIEDGLAAVSAAQRALRSWSDTPPRHRSEVLRRAYELMTRDADRLATLITLENGKALADSRSEVGYAAEFFRWFAEEAVRIEGSVAVAPSGANRIVTLRQPIGVAVLVTPWNFPAAMATRKIAPALAAGCSVVLKPASETPLTALALTEVLAEAGVPPGVVNVVVTEDPGPVVATMLDDPRVRKLSFTGSTEVGRVLLGEAARTIVSCAMELGGNAPFVVFDDADLDEAVAGAMVAKMRNGGEACTAANRFYVQSGVMEEFGRRLAEQMGGLVVGDGLEAGVQVGPLITRQERDKVAGMAAAAASSGARVLTGGEVPSRPGWFYPPTVLTDVRPDSAILRREIFGPVAPLVAFADEAEAIALANATEHGLIGYVFTADLGRGLRISEALEAGMVGLNRGVVSDPAAPFGGTKQSGLGREGGHDGILEFTETKYIAMSW